MTSLLILKDNYTLKDARMIAKDNMISTKCRTVLWGLDLYYCFGEIPSEDIEYEMNLTDDLSIIFLIIL